MKEKEKKMMWLYKVKYNREVNTDGLLETWKWVNQFMRERMRQEVLGLSPEGLHTLKSKIEDDELSKVTEHEVPLRKEDCGSSFLPRSQQRKVFAFKGNARSTIWKKKWDWGYLRTWVYLDADRKAPVDMTWTEKEGKWDLRGLVYVRYIYWYCVKKNLLHEKSKLRNY